GDVLAGRGIFGRDLRPVALELLGDQLGKAGQAALAHLGACDANDDGVVRPHDNPDAELGRTFGRANHVRAERQVQAQREAAAGCGGADHERATIDLWQGIQGRPLSGRAGAAWIAWGTGWRVPHRKIWVMASLISASVGFGFCLSSAAPAMIMPLWQ